MEGKGEDEEKREFFLAGEHNPRGKGIKIRGGGGRTRPGKKGDLMAGEVSPGRKGLKPLGKSKITGSEVNLKYPEQVQDSCSLHDPVPNNAV